MKNHKSFAKKALAIHQSIIKVGVSEVWLRQEVLNETHVKTHHITDSVVKLESIQPSLYMSRKVQYKF